MVTTCGFRHATGEKCAAIATVRGETPYGVEHVRCDDHTRGLVPWTMAPIRPGSDSDPTE